MVKNGKSGNHGSDFADIEDVLWSHLTSSTTFERSSLSIDHIKIWINEIKFQKLEKILQSTKIGHQFSDGLMVLGNENAFFS